MFKGYKKEKRKKTKTNKQKKQKNIRIMMLISFHLQFCVRFSQITSQMYAGWLSSFDQSEFTTILQKLENGQLFILIHWLVILMT